jgi:uncharacterized membrane protein YphA (DoxX/SURF4 family)
MALQTPLLILSIILAVIAAVAGAAKLSGSPRGLAGARDVGSPDGLSRLAGMFELLAGISLVIGLAFAFIDLIVWGLVTLWIVMIGAIFFHFRSRKIKSGFPAFLILTLTTIALTLALK